MPLKNFLRRIGWILVITGACLGFGGWLAYLSLPEVGDGAEDGPTKPLMEEEDAIYLSCFGFILAATGAYIASGRKKWGWKQN